MKQGSKEWLKARQGKITGSRVGSILGVSKWNKTSDVMREMVREYFDADREFTGNIATRWGNEHEPIAKQDAIIEISNLEGEEVYCLDDGFLTHPAIDWIGASPDGLLGKMRDEEIIYGLEIKCPFSLIIKDHIPQDHICQMQLCMAVYGLSEWWYYQWTPNKTSLMKIERDSSWISDRWEVLNGFILQYNRIIENKALAEPFLQDLEKEVQTEAWKEAVHNYSAVKIEHDLALETLEDAKALLIEIAKKQGVAKCYGDGISVTKVIKKGSIKYSGAWKEASGKYEMLDVDLEKHRGKDSIYFRIGEKK